MPDHSIYQKRIGKVRLEIGGALGQRLASVYYEGAGDRFEQGGLDVVLDAALAMLEEVCRSEPHSRLFVGPFEPVVPTGSSRMEEARTMFQDFQTALQGRPIEEIGQVHLLRGVWFDLREGIELLREVASRSSALSAEESLLRLVMLARAQGSNGWDLMHRDGGTHLGRWTGNVEKRPGTLEANDRPVAQAALEAAAAVIDRRLGGS